MLGGTTRTERTPDTGSSAQTERPPTDTATPPSPLIPAAAVVVWLILFNILARHTWGYGVLTFCLLMVIGLLVVLAGRLRKIMLPQRWGTPHLRQLIVLLAVFMTLVMTILHTRVLVLAVGNPKSKTSLIDMGVNTFEAGRRLFSYRQNPYANRCQYAADVSHADNVAVRAGLTTMFGVPYHYGYPYLPMMFLSYEPARRLIPDLNAIRTTNLVLLLLGLAGVGWLSGRLARPPDRWLAVALASSAFVGVAELGVELFHLGVTDIVIAVYSLVGFLAVSYRKPVLAGILFGMACASKFLPGGFLACVMVIWYTGRPGARRFTVALAATALAIVVPFVLWNPPAFLSATVLFYATFHSAGDDTALWYFLPPGLRPPFLALGGAVVLTAFVAAWFHRRRELPVALKFAFLTYAAFAAFNKMTHLNYLWAVYPLGCVALVSGILGSTRPAREDALPPAEGIEIAEDAPGGRSARGDETASAITSEIQEGPLHPQAP